MADTWTLYNQGITFAATKNMAAILNGGSNVLRIARVGLLNSQTGAVTGVACFMELRWYPATATLTTPTSVTPVAHDSTNAALSSVTAGNSGTAGGSTPVTLRRIFWSSDEPAISSATSDELETYVPLNVIWDAGYGDTDVQKLAVRQNQMVTVHNTTGAAGLLDSWIEFTNAGS